MASLMKLASAAIRGLIVAPPGKQLVVSDLSNIEGRIVAWLANEEWKIKAFAEYDAGRGEDIYKLTAAGILNKPAKEVTKAERNAFGKVSELACLALGTKVLTDRGWLPIENVSLSDRVHDGESFVGHGGLAFLGYKPVLSLQGIRATMDHLFLTSEGTWLPADQLTAPLFSKAVDLATSLLKGRRATNPCADAFCAGELPLLTGATCAAGAAPAAQRAREKAARSSGVSTELRALMKIGAGFSTGYTPRLGDALILSTALTPTTAAAASTSICHGWRTRAPSSITCSLFPVGMIRSRLSIALTTTRVTFRAICDSEPIASSSLTARTPSGSSTADGSSRFKSSIASTPPAMRDDTPSPENSARVSLPSGSSPSSMTSLAAPTGREPSRLSSGMRARIGLLTRCGKALLPAISAFVTSFARSKRGLMEMRSSPTNTPTTGEVAPVFDLLNCGPRNRFVVLSDIGPVIAHNCGYEGGAGAFLTFANNYQIDLGPLWPSIQTNLPGFAGAAQENIYGWGPRADGFEGEVWPTEYDNGEMAWLAGETIKLGWRFKHPATKGLWLTLKNAAIEAIRAPGTVVPAGPRLRMKAQVHQGNLWLFLALPSGRYVTYFDPKIEGSGWSYMGVDTKQGSPTYGQWIRMNNFGGRTLEQATQGTARDVLYDAMPKVEAAGFRIVMHVHDELVTEADMGRTSAELSSILAAGETWTAGLPLAAAGFECDRYRKEG